MSLRRALWLIPLGIAAHNAEEHPKMVDYAERHGWRTWFGLVGRRRWRVAILLATVLPFLITAMAVMSPRGSHRMNLALALPAVFAFNAITHRFQTVRHRDYMPGTVTGVAINVSLAPYIYRWALREGCLSCSRSRRLER